MQNDLTALIALADNRRFERANTLGTMAPCWDGEAWSAEVSSASTPGITYTARIQLRGKRSFRCTCPDHARHVAGDRRPCKHVVALAMDARSLIEAGQVKIPA